MKLVFSILLVAMISIAVPYTLTAEGSEMKTVPFWWSTDPVTGEEVYTDYFKTSAVQREHNTYLAETTKVSEVPVIIPSTEVDDMTEPKLTQVEVITYEYRMVLSKDSKHPQPIFQNPNYPITELVPISTWITVPVTEIITTDPITGDITDDITDDITEITPEIVTEMPVVNTPPEVKSREVNYDSNTHWDTNEQQHVGQEKMSLQEYKDMKKHHEAQKAYDRVAKLTDYKAIYPTRVVQVVDVPIITLPYTEPIQEPVSVIAPIPEQPIVVPIPEQPIVVPTDVSNPLITSINNTEQVIIPIQEQRIVVPIPDYDTTPSDEEWNTILDGMISDDVVVVPLN